MNSGSWLRDTAKANSGQDDIQFAYYALTIIILHLSMNFARELVVLHTIPSMFGKFFEAWSEIVWGFNEEY